MWLGLASGLVRVKKINLAFALQASAMHSSPYV